MMIQYMLMRNSIAADAVSASKTSTKQPTQTKQNK